MDGGGEVPEHAVVVGGDGEPEGGGIDLDEGVEDVGEVGELNGGGWRIRERPCRPIACFDRRLPHERSPCCNSTI